MKKIPKDTRMLAQCPKCHSIKIDAKDKYNMSHWINSIVVFEKLPKEACFNCKK